MADLQDCILFCDDEGIKVRCGEQVFSNVYTKIVRGHYYVSFYADSYRHWARGVRFNTPFTAHRTKDYQYFRNPHKAQQLRLDRVVRSTRNKHAKSKY